MTVWVDFLNLVVGGDKNSLGSDVLARLFDLDVGGVEVSPLLEMLGSYLVGAHLLYDDCFFVLVPAPPLVVVLDVSVGPLCPDCVRLSSASFSPVPLVLEVGQSLRFGAEEVIALDGVLELLHLLDFHVARVYRRSSAHLDDFRVAILGLSENVTPCRLEAKLPGAFLASFFFEAIIRGAVITGDWCPVILMVLGHC